MTGYIHVLVMVFLIISQLICCRSSTDNVSCCVADDDRYVLKIGYSMHFF